MAASGGHASYLPPVKPNHTMTRAMKHLLAIVPLFFALTLWAQGPTDPWPGQLVGRWEGEVGAGRYVEAWTRVDDLTYDGAATMYKDGQPVGHERMRLMYFADQWLLIASTGGRNITSFVRLPAADATWIFENREHDFPKRIGYRVHGDMLSAWIDDGEEGGPRMDFKLDRKE